MCSQLDDCCCGCSLRTGTTIIGVFSLATSVGVVTGRAKNNSAFQWISVHSDDILDYYLWIGFAMLSMLTTVLVLLSAWKNRMPRLLLPWLLIQIPLLIALCSLLLFWAVRLIPELDRSSLGLLGFLFGIGYLSVAFAVAVVGFYFWLVVLSYYRELKVKAMVEQQESGEKDAGQYHD